MHLIDARNVHEALPLAVHYIVRNGHRRESRAGDVLVAPTPVTTLYQAPSEMCCFWPERDVNPFATLFEGLWMLAGRNDVDYPARFIPHMRAFSDDGRTLHGAYGARWRRAFGFDQLETIAERLKADPNDRRQILQMWDACSDLDLQEGKKDIPCNTIVHFQVNVYGSLDMTVFNRSNDLVWGTYGADAPHFGMLLQYMAKKIGRPVGRYWQVSNNWHAYLKTLEPIKGLQEQARVEHYSRARAWSPYETGFVHPLDMMKGVPDGDTSEWDTDLHDFMQLGHQAIGYRTWFFRRVAAPLHHAHAVYKSREGEERYIEAAKVASDCQADDWRAMCVAWLERRLLRYRENNSG